MCVCAGGMGYFLDGGYSNAKDQSPNLDDYRNEGACFASCCNRTAGRRSDVAGGTASLATIIDRRRLVPIDISTDLLNIN